MIRKAFVIILILIAIPLYLWDVWLVVQALGIGKQPHNASQELSSAHSAPLATAALVRTVHFSPRGRSPFEPTRIDPPRPVAVQKPSTEPRPKAAVVREVVQAPSVKITGIMWNPTRPVVMLSLPGGGSTAVSAGQDAGEGIMVKAIEKNRVRIHYNGTDFWIDK